MSLDEEPKTEPGYIITIQLTHQQRVDLDAIKDIRATVKGRPLVRDLILEAVQQFIDRELKKK